MPRDLKGGVGTAVILHRLDHSVGWQVLMGYRQGCALSEHWAIPGGWLDHGEQPIDGVVRELAEETGLVLWASEVRLFDVLSHPVNDDVWVTTVAYHAYWESHTKGPKEMESERLSDGTGRFKIGCWTWFSPTDIPKNITPFTKDAIRSFLKHTWDETTARELHPEKG